MTVTASDIKEGITFLSSLSDELKRARYHISDSFHSNDNKGLQGFSWNLSWDRPFNLSKPKTP